MKWSGIRKLMDCVWEDEKFGVRKDHHGFYLGPPNAGAPSWKRLEEDVGFIKR